MPPVRELMYILMQNHCGGSYSSIKLVLVSPSHLLATAVFLMSQIPPQHVFLKRLQQWRTAGAEVQVPCVENLELTNGPRFKPAAGHNVTMCEAMHVSSAAGDFFPVLISTVLVHSGS